MISDEQQAIDDGVAVSQFLSSEVGQKIKEETGKIIYNEWRIADTVEKREAAYAKSEAFNTLFAVMENIQVKGQNADAIRQRRVKVAEQQEAVYGKKK